MAVCGGRNGGGGGGGNARRGGGGAVIVNIFLAGFQLTTEQPLPFPFFLVRKINDKSHARII